MTGQLQASVYDGSRRSATAAGTDNVYQIFEYRGDGTHIFLREGLSGAAWTQVSGGYAASVSSNMRIGIASDSFTGFSGNIAMMLLSWTAFSDATFDAIKASLRSEWGI